MAEDHNRRETKGRHEIGSYSYTKSLVVIKAVAMHCFIMQKMPQRSFRPYPPNKRALVHDVPNPA